MPMLREENGEKGMDKRLESIEWSDYTHNTDGWTVNDASFCALDIIHCACGCHAITFNFDGHAAGGTHTYIHTNTLTIHKASSDDAEQRVWNIKIILLKCHLRICREIYHKCINAHAQHIIQSLIYTQHKAHSGADECVRNNGQQKHL